EPGAVGVTVVSETVHRSGVSERNETSSPVPSAGVAVVTDDAVNLTGWPTAVSDGWSKVICCGILAGARADGRLPATAPAPWARGRSTAGPHTTAARRQNPRNAHSLDQRTVERQATLPASLFRLRTLPIGCGSMTALLAPCKRPIGHQPVIPVIREVSGGAPADTCSGVRPSRMPYFRPMHHPLGANIPRFPLREVKAWSQSILRGSG